MKTIRWFLLIVVILWGVQSMTSCATVKGAGEDLETLGNGMSKQYQTPPQVQQDSVRK